MTTPSRTKIILRKTLIVFSAMQNQPNPPRVGNVFCPPFYQPMLGKKHCLPNLLLKKP
jgi:hypothetical protein